MLEQIVGEIAEAAAEKVLCGAVEVPSLKWILV